MTSPRLVINDGRVIDPAGGFDRIAPVCVADETIVSVGHVPDGFCPDRVLSVPGQIVCPGFIDVAVRLREPGQAHKGTIESEGRAARAGGVTTVCIPPDTVPAIDTPAVFKLVQERAQQSAAVRVVPVGALTRALNGRDLSEMGALQAAGCIAVGNAAIPLASSLVMRRAFEYAASYDLLVMIRAQDASLREGGCAHEGTVAMRLGLPGIPEAAETVAVAQALVLVELTGVRAHFCQISSGRAVQMIAAARDRGVSVSMDTAMHQLHLTEDHLEGFDSRCHVDPPLRSVGDRDALRAAVAAGSIELLCSDHQPHDPDAKDDVFGDTETGISSVETLLPLGLELVDRDMLSMAALIDRLTFGPAKLLGLDSGRLQEGRPADLCIFDPARRWVVDSDTWRSAGHNTPFWGGTMIGRVTHTLVAGRVYEDT